MLNGISFKMRLSEVGKRLNSQNANSQNIPSLFMITDSLKMSDPIKAAIRLPRGSGIILRDYDFKGREALALSLMSISRKSQLKLLVAGDPELAIKIGAAGLHLPETLVTETRRWRYRKNWLITIAAHSRPGLRYATMCGADAVLLSPVFKTTTHPLTPPLGIHQFKLLSIGVSIPIYALGGINSINANKLLNTPAAGIAAIDAFSC